MGTDIARGAVTGNERDCSSRLMRRSFGGVVVGASLRHIFESRSLVSAVDVSAGAEGVLL